MNDLLAILRRERNARLLLAAHAQSTVGSAAAYVALLVVAHDRLGSSWAVTLVLLADFLPALLLGPLLGALVDRWSPRRCMLLGDALRIVAFALLAIGGGLLSTVALALLAGIGTALFVPSIKASMAQLISEERQPAAMGLYGIARDAGWLAGPPIAAGLIAATSAPAVLLINAGTFAVSILLVLRLRFAATHTNENEPAPEPASLSPLALVTDARDGLRALRALPVVLVTMLAVAAMSLTGGIYNVGEPLLALDVLHAGSAGFAAITWAGAAGMLLGTVLSSSARETAQFRTRIMLGVLLCAAGYAGAASAPHLLAAVAALFFVGLGNGLILGPSQMLIQRLVPESLHGRAFGLADALFSAGLVGGLLGAGAVAAASDARVIFAVAAGIAAAVAFTLSLALRATDAREPVAAVPVGLEVT